MCRITPILMVCLLTAGTVRSQPCDLTTDLDALGIPAIGWGVTLYHSAGQDDHAYAIFGRYLTFASIVFDSLETYIDGAVAILTESDWAALRQRVDWVPPAGMAFYGCNVAVVQTPTAPGVMFSYNREAFLRASQSAREAVISVAAQQGLTADEAIERITDYQWAHEWGHDQSLKYLGAPPPPFHEPFWLVELLGNMYMYAAITELEPDLVALYRTLNVAMLEGYTSPEPHWGALGPAEDFYVRHIGGAAPMSRLEYGWYMSWLSLRAADLFDTYGYQFVRDLRGLTSLWNDFDALIDEVDAIAPGTRSWATPMEDVDREVPFAYRLDQNYPNPFNPSTTFTYELPVAAHVTLTVHDLLGNEVRVLAEGVRSPGSHSAVLDADGLPSGIYFYTLTAGDFIATRHMVLLR